MDHRAYFSMPVPENGPPPTPSSSPAVLSSPGQPRFQLASFHHFQHQTPPDLVSVSPSASPQMRHSSENFLPPAHSLLNGNGSGPSSPHPYFSSSGSFPQPPLSPSPSPSLRLSSLSISSSSPFSPLPNSNSPISNGPSSSFESIPPISSILQFPPEERINGPPGKSPSHLLHIPIAQMASSSSSNNSPSLTSSSASIPTLNSPSVSTSPSNFFALSPLTSPHISALPRASSLPQLSAPAISSSPLQEDMFHLETSESRISSSPTDEVYQAATLLSVLATAVDRVQIRGSSDSVPNTPPSVSSPRTVSLASAKRSFSSSSLTSLAAPVQRSSSPLSTSTSSTSKLGKRTQMTDEDENGLKKQRKNCRGRPIVITQMNDLQGVDKIRTAQVFLSSLPYLAWMKQDDVVLLQLLPEFRGNFGDGLKVVLETDLSRAMGNLVSRSLEGIAGLETRRQNLTWPKRKFLQQQIDDLPPEVRCVVDMALESVPAPSAENGSKASGAYPTAFPSPPVRKDEVLVVMADNEDMESYRSSSQGFNALSPFSIWPDEVSYFKAAPVLETVRSMLEKYGNGETSTMNNGTANGTGGHPKGFSIVCFTPVSCSVTAKCRFASVLSIIQKISPGAELRLLRPVCKNESVLLSFERSGTVIQSRKQGKNNMSKRIGSSSAISLLVELGYRLTTNSPVIAHMRNVQNGAIHRYMSWLHVFIVALENISSYGPLHRLALLLRAFLLLPKQYRLLAQPQQAIENNGVRYPSVAAILTPPSTPSPESSPLNAPSSRPFPELLRKALFKEVPPPTASPPASMRISTGSLANPKAVVGSLSAGQVAPGSPLSYSNAYPATATNHPLLSTNSPSFSPSSSVPSPTSSPMVGGRKAIRSSTGSINSTFGLSNSPGGSSLTSSSNGLNNSDLNDEILPVRTAGPFYDSMVALWSKSLSPYLNLTPSRNLRIDAPPL